MKDRWTTVEPVLDFDSPRKLRKGQRPAKGELVLEVTADDLPPGWPAGKPYRCTCGCGKTVRTGDRWAVRNLRTVGFAPEGAFRQPRVAKATVARAIRDAEGKGR